MTGRRDTPSRSTVTARPLPLGTGGLALWASYSDQRFARHAHEGYALGVIEAGGLAFRYRGSRLVAPAGSVNLVQPGVPHDGEPALPGGWRYRMLYIPVEVLAMVQAQGVSPPYFRQGVIEDPELAGLVADVHKMLFDAEADALARQARLLSLLAYWVRRHATEGRTARAPGPEPRAVRRALEVIAERFAEPITLADLSAATGLSPWHLTRVVARSTGLPPHAHLLARRLRAAKDALTSQARLADIAAASGFADQSHLTRAFVAHFGMPPGAYRKIVQNSGRDQG
ncbi:transcriptional regulator, AraC family [Solidesulfovibrio fructosivorans JJ]]|uniref:Transcriptional regulator, AraC family n=1 Tax=Solidesulfovibrio fructosivorans JJ] TaxID=596151 RepID=E1JU45_SOLFR|nr:AraC family transcriptional regulator [Solidesulfovibrio fructosivorans]EFL51975.1 transcriptional regulator, AraC family [Solidesulfovibrio fructosivorans JJ]]